MKYVFGPVHSRRLGISLGIDVIPLKICSFNCIYCECGVTTELTDEVKEYFPFDEIAAEIESVLDGRPELDVITFSGSGEPTLYSRLGDLIDFIKKRYPQYKVAVLTNSSLLHNADIRRGLLRADIIYPSLDAVTPAVFDRIMRPISGTDPQKIVESLIALRGEFHGELCVEIFIIHGINDTEDELEKLKWACERISPDEIHLNQLDRPGVEEWVSSATEENMERIRDFFYPLPVRVISRPAGSSHHTDYLEKYEEQVLKSIATEGTTAGELALKLNMREFEMHKVLKKLEHKRIIKKVSESDRDVFVRE